MSESMDDLWFSERVDFDANPNFRGVFHHRRTEEIVNQRTGEIDPLTIFVFTRPGEQVFYEVVGTAVLKRELDSCQEGDRIGIQYQGKVQAKNGGMMRSFRIGRENKVKSA